MKWKNKNKNIGDIRGTSKKVIEFTATQDLDIRTLRSDCGCTKPVYNSKKRKLKVIFTPNSFPEHLKHLSVYKTTKYIYIEYNNGEKDVLSFSANILKI